MAVSLGVICGMKRGLIGMGEKRCEVERKVG
jgi:hypothetical protein